MINRPNPYLGAPRRFAEDDAVLAEAMIASIDTMLVFHKATEAVLEYSNDAVADFHATLSDLKADTWAIVLANAKEALGE